MPGLSAGLPVTLAGCGSGGAEPKRHRGPERLLCRLSGTSSRSPPGPVRPQPAASPRLRPVAVSPDGTAAAGSRLRFRGPFPGPAVRGHQGGTAECQRAGDHNKDAAAAIVEPSQ